MDNKKAVAAALAAALSASGAAAATSFDNPADLLQETKVEPVVEHMDSSPDALGSQDDDQDGEEKKGQPARSGVVREFILGLPIAVRAVVVLPLWVLGVLVMQAGSLLFAGLSPIWSALLGFVLLFAVLLAAFTLTAKAIFPDLPLKKILNRHTIKWVFAASVLAFLADWLAGALWADYARFRYIVKGVLLLIGLGVPVFVFVKREKRRRKKAAEELEEEKEEEPEELVFHSLGETFRVRMPKG